MTLFENCIRRETEYLHIKECTKKCQELNLNYGVSFYGAAHIMDSNVVKYKRIEVWCAKCPTAQELNMIKSLFTKYLPVKNNTCFAFYDGDLRVIN